MILIHFLKKKEKFKPKRQDFLNFFKHRFKRPKQKTCQY